MSARVFTFNKIGGKWFYVTAPDLGNLAIEMPTNTWPLLDFAAQGKDDISLKMLRKNTLERVKISLGRIRYMKGGALYFILDYTGAIYGTREIGKRAIWIGNATRKILNNFPEVINLTW